CGFVAASSVRGAAGGASASTLPPLRVDLHRRWIRGRAFAAYGVATVCGVGIGASTVLVVDVAGLTWRTAFGVLGILTLAIVIGASRLRDVPTGRWDERRIVGLVHAEAGGLGSDSSELDEVDTKLRLGQSFRQVTR